MNAESRVASGEDMIEEKDDVEGEDACSFGYSCVGIMILLLVWSESRFGMLDMLETVVAVNDPFLFLTSTAGPDVGVRDGHSGNLRETFIASLTIQNPKNEHTYAARV
jgi:hypothetical protein